MRKKDFSESLNTTTDIITAPDEIKRKHSIPITTSGRVSVFVNGMIIVETRLGEIVLKLKEGLHIEPGTRVSLRIDQNGKTAQLSTKRPNPQQVIAPKSHAVDPIMDQPVRLPSPQRYKAQKQPHDMIDGHSTSANAVANIVLRAPNKPDAFNLARAINLLPETCPKMSAISSATFLLVCLSRGGLKAWAGTTSESLHEIWDNLMKEVTISVPGMGVWQVSQFPIQTPTTQKWALFALAESTNTAVARFIVEIPTDQYGITQIKGFGSASTCELLISSTKPIPIEVSEEITKMIKSIAADIETEMRITFTNDPKSLVNFSQARRTSFGI